MPYLMGGFPTSTTSRRIGLAYARGGADLVELGVPFSDPLADGPVIHAAGDRGAATPGPRCRRCSRSAARSPSASRWCVMCYANLIFARGLERFADALVAAGVSGLIVPDLPLEEAAGDAARRATRAGSRWCRWSRRPRPTSGWRGSARRRAASLHGLADRHDRRARGRRRRPRARSCGAPRRTPRSRSRSGSGSARPSRPRPRRPAGADGVIVGSAARAGRGRGAGPGRRRSADLVGGFAAALSPPSAVASKIPRRWA